MTHDLGSVFVWLSHAEVNRQTSCVNSHTDFSLREKLIKCQVQGKRLILRLFCWCLFSVIKRKSHQKVWNEFLMNHVEWNFKMFQQKEIEWALSSFVSKKALTSWQVARLHGCFVKLLISKSFKKYNNEKIFVKLHKSKCFAKIYLWKVNFKKRWNISKQKL